MVSQCIYSGARLGEVKKSAKHLPQQAVSWTRYEPGTSRILITIVTVLTNLKFPQRLQYWLWNKQNILRGFTGPWIRSMNNWLTEIRVGRSSCVTVSAIADRLTAWRLEWIYIKIQYESTALSTLVSTLVSTPPQLLEQHCFFFSASRLQPLVLLIRVVLKWIWVWSCIILPSVACAALQRSSTLSHKRQD
jgi:hypothetical protein